MRAGEVYENRVQGDRFVVRAGSADTEGERLVGDLYVRPGGRVAGKHTHAYITERFEVLSGTVRFHVDGRDELARPGEQVEVRPGVVHDWWNVGDDEAHVLVDIRPAERFELMIENLYGLANDGKANARGVPRLLPLALFAREFRREGEFISPPRTIQRLLFSVLAPLARARGYKAINPEYLGPTGRQPISRRSKNHAPADRASNLVGGRPTTRLPQRARRNSPGRLQGSLPHSWERSSLLAWPAVPPGTIALRRRDAPEYGGATAHHVVSGRRWTCWPRRAARRWPG